MAKRRGVKTPAIHEQIKKNKLTALKMAGVKFIYDAEAAAVFHAQHPECKNITADSLVWLPHFAKSMKVAPATLYEEIIFGNINAFTAANKIFLSPNDPPIIKYFESRTRQKRRTRYEIRQQRGY